MPPVTDTSSSESKTPASGQQTFSAACLRGRPSIKVFATDLDGTLLPPSLKVSERAVAAFSKLHQLGVQCAVATGRPLYSTVSCIGLETLQRLQLPHGHPGVYMNGSVVIGKDGQLLHADYISQEGTQQVVAQAEKRGWLPRLTGYSETNVYCLEEDEFTLTLHKNYGEIAPQVVSREVFQNTRFFKLALSGTPEDISKIRRVMEEVFQTADVRMVCAIPCSLEICPAQATKAAGLRVLLESFQAQPEELLVIGDSENDVEMLRLAGVSVAVDNALEDAKKAAAFVTCRCDEDAVAKVAECVAEVLQERKQKNDAAGVVEGETTAARKQNAVLPAAPPSTSRSG